MIKSELINKIKRKFGWPMVKVELCDDHIKDFIQESVNMHIKWAIGNSTDIIYFTLPLEGGKKFYDMPKGVIDIIEYDDAGNTGGINTLFSIENYFFNQGYYDPMLSYPYSMLGYHMVLDFMETLDKYNPDKYSWRYHKKTNQLELSPTPQYNENKISVERIDPKTNTVKTYILDSPGYILLRANVIEGTTLPYVIRDWDKVMKEILPASELRIININEKDNQYFVLNSPAYKGNLSIYKNGYIYNDWLWHDDARKIIKWNNKDDIKINDELLLKYNKVNISDSLDDRSYIDDIKYTEETYTINSLNIASKSFMLSQKTINSKDVIIKYNNNDYIYGTGFIMDTDNQTILFNGKQLDGLLIDNDVIKIIYVDESSNIEEYDESIYDNLWILNYATALSKITLGMIRRKFSNFSSIGNTGISLDGSDLISEGQQEKEKLEEELKDEEVYIGGYITMG
jgi:hypothetical protein